MTKEVVNNYCRGIRLKCSVMIKYFTTPHMSNKNRGPSLKTTKYFCSPLLLRGYAIILIHIFRLIIQNEIYALPLQLTLLRIMWTPLSSTKHFMSPISPADHNCWQLPNCLLWSVGLLHNYVWGLLYKHISMWIPRGLR